MNLLTCAYSSTDTKADRTGQREEENNKEKINVRCQVSSVRCQVAHFTCHVLCVTCHLSSVTYHISPVNCYLSLTTTARATDPPPANSSDMQIRLVQKKPKT